MGSHRMTSVRAVGIVLGVWIVAILAGLLAAEELRVPAFTAYALPDANGARISERDGVTRWTDPALTVNWYGEFFLSHGGFVAGFTKFGEKFTRPTAGQPPVNMVLPPLRP